MLRYTIYRVLVFAACVGLLWLAGLRGDANVFPLVVAAAVLSAVVSYFGLRRYRETYSRELSERIERRTAAHAAHQVRTGTGTGTGAGAGAGSSDEAAEDAEIGADDGPAAKVDNG